MCVAETTIKELVRARIKSEKLSMEKLAREADLSFRQFVTVVNGGITKGTRVGPLEKVAKVLVKEPSELIRLTVEE